MQEQIFAVNSSTFDSLALDIFQFQGSQNPIYRQYLQYLGINTRQITAINQIPFLPIEFFKTQEIYIGATTPEKIFKSSGTTMQITSSHLVKEISLYEKSFVKGFEYFYGPISEYVFLALLPSYLEREGSSLVYMVEHLIKHSQHPESAFYLYNYADLYTTLHKLQEGGKKKVMLIGVTFALLEFSERFKLHFPELMVLETGGMKGRRKELIREELHSVLCEAFGVSKIHSEYGMTELLAQAYSKGDGIFEPAPWMKIYIREALDPFTWVEEGRTGALNVVDLANLYSCSFIATQDLGKKHSSSSFEVLGRFDNSDIRGCNLMMSV